MVLFHQYYRELQQYEITLEKASGTIRGLLSPALQRKYYDEKWDSNPKGLWDAIRMDRERIFKVDGRQLMDKLGSIKFADFASSEDFYTEIQRVASQLKIVDVDIDDPMLAYYMTKALPTTPEWDQFTTMLNMTKQDKKPEDVYIALEAHEAKLRAKHSIPADTALFAKGGTRYNTSGKSHGYGKTNGGKEGSDSASKKGKRSPVVCYGCGKQGHKKKECRSHHLWKENQCGQATVNTVGPPSGGTETDDLILTIAETSEMDEAIFYEDIQQESVGVQVQLFPPREFPEPDWTDTGPVDQNIPEPVPNAIDIDREKAAPAVPPEAVERVARRRRRGDDLSIDMNWQPVGGEGTTRSGRHRSQQEEVHSIVHSILYAVPGPSNYREAVAAEDSDYWQEAIASEMKALQHHDVLEPIIRDLPPSDRIVDSKWVFSIKLNVDGSKDKYKAHLVACGFSQNPEDYGSITSPVIGTAAIRNHHIQHEFRKKCWEGQRYLKPAGNNERTKRSREHPRTMGVLQYSVEQHWQKKGIGQPYEARERHDCEAAEYRTCEDSERELQAYEQMYGERQQKPVSNDGGTRAKSTLNSGNFSTDSRHMRLRFHHLVDCIAKQQLSIRHVSTGDMWADGLTKPLGGNKHHEFLQVLGMKDVTVEGKVDGTVAGGVLGHEA